MKGQQTPQSPNVEVALEKKPSGLIHLKFREQAHNKFFIDAHHLNKN